MDLDISSRTAFARQVAPLYLFWGLLISVGAYLGIASEYTHLEHSFTRQAERIAQQIGRTSKTQEVALEGFAQFLSLSPPPDFDSARQYASTLRQHYPELYMFEIAERVEAAERNPHEQQQQSVTPDYHIHGFNFTGDRHKATTGQHTQYYPIVFIEPALPELTDLLGLDLLNSSTPLSDALNRSLLLGHPVSSAPFQLLENERGFVMFRAVHLKNSNPNAEQPQYTAILVVRSSDLLPKALLKQPGISLSLRFTTPFASLEPLIEIDTPRQGLEKWLFPTFRHAINISSLSGPILLNVNYQPGWEDVDITHLITVSALLLIITLIALRNIRGSIRSQKADLTHQLALYHQANYDNLTHLPNTNLLMDRLEQSIKHAQRNHVRVMIGFLDLDHFKSVNDRWGHDTGDQLLQQVGQRLEGILRQQDTVSRIHGDEFIILMPSINDDMQAEHLKAKVLQAFAQPFSLGQFELSVGCSIGISTYPEDGCEPEELIALADQRMYAFKRKQRTTKIAAPAR